MAKLNPDGSYTLNSGKKVGTDRTGLTQEEIDEISLARGVSRTTSNISGAEPRAWEAGANAIGGLFGFIPNTIDPSAPGASLTVDPANAQREQAGDLISSMQQQAATGDGAWQGRFQDAVRQSMASTQALGQSQEGGAVGSKFDNIQRAQGGVQQRSVGDGQILRAQSQLDARGQLGDILGRQAQMDIGQSTEQARIDRERRAANQALVDQSLENRQSTEKGIMGAFGMSDGGEVPGKPKVFGDDSRNDTVTAKLSPKEIVIPISIASRPDAPEAAARFVAAVKAGYNPQGGDGYAEGGGIRPATSEEMGGAGVGFLNFLLPHVGRKMQFDALNKSVGAGGGGTIDTQQYDQTAGQQSQLASLFAGQAAGSGPSIVPAMQQRATDDTMGAAMAAQGRGGMPAGDVLQAAGRQGNATAMDAGQQTAREQSQGQSAYAKAVQQRRAQEMQLASAQQQAGWAKTMADAGMSLKNQAALRGAVGAAGQGAAAFAGAGGASGDRYASDLEGDRGGPADLGVHGNDEPDFGEFETPDFALGGIVGYAGGGKVQPYAEFSRKMRAQKLEQQANRPETREERKRREYEEETGDDAYVPKAKKAPTQEESMFAKAYRAAADLGKKASASVHGYAEGGGIPDAGSDPYVGFPYTDMPRPPSVGQVVYVSPTPVPGTQPVDVGGAGGGAPDTGAMGAGGAGGSGVMPQDRGSGGATGGPSGNQIPQHEAIQPRAERPAMTLPQGVTPKGASAPPPSSPVSASPAMPKARSTGTGLVDTGQASALAEQKAGVAAGVDADVARARAEVEGAAAKASAIESAMLARKDVEARAKQRTDDAMAKYQQARDEMARIDTTVDPGRFWATRSTGDRVVGIIGLALGALGAGPDGINRAAVMLNQAIDRDLEAQKAQHELRLKKGAANVSGAQTFYAMARDAAGDELAAADLARASALEAAAAKADQLVAATKEPQAKATGMQLSGALSAGAAAAKAAALEKMRDRNLEREKIEASRAKAELPQAEKSKAIEVQERTSNIRANIKKAKDLIKKSGTFELIGTEQVELERALGDIAQDSARLKDPNSTVKEQELINAKKAIGVMGGEIFTLRNGVASSLLDSFEQDMDAREDEAMRVRGLPTTRRAVAP